MKRSPEDKQMPVMRIYDHTCTTSRACSSVLQVNDSRCNNLSIKGLKLDYLLSSTDVFKSSRILNHSLHSLPLCLLMMQKVFLKSRWRYWICSVTPFGSRSTRVLEQIFCHNISRTHLILSGISTEIIVTSLDIARAIICEFPHLRDLSENGYCTWYQSITDSLKITDVK